MALSSAPDLGAEGSGTGALGASGVPQTGAAAALSSSGGGGVAELSDCSIIPGIDYARALVTLRVLLVPSGTDLPFWAAVAFFGGIAENTQIR